MGKCKVGVLISGRGSNLQALIDAASAPDYPAEIALVISNIPGAGGLDRAALAGIAHETIDHTAYNGKAEFEAAVHASLSAAGIELICLAGFMRILSAEFLSNWQDRVINIHPSLLPSFKGLDTHQKALDAGVRITGCTVHYVTPKMDAGPIIAQAAVPVLQDDDESSLAARILTKEHEIYPLALDLVASGQTRIDGDRVILDETAWATTSLVNPTG